MPKTKAKTTTKTKTTAKANKQEQQTICYLCKIVFALAIVLGIGFIGIIIGGCFKKPAITDLEKRELEAFESIFQKEIDQEFYKERFQTASLTNIGLSEDDDLYGDFTIYYYGENHEITETQNGKIFLQCDHEYRKPVTGDDPKSCAFAYSYEDKVPYNN